MGWVDDIERLTLENDTFRTVVFTGEHAQLTVMSIPVGDDIGLEVHPDNDQFIRIEQGSARVELGPSKDALDERHDAGPDWAIIVPAGTWHNVVNVGDDELKVYSLYSPPHHPDGTVHATKADAEAAEEAEHQVEHAAVTGAARGIGRAVARRLAADGWTVSLFDRDEEGLRATAEELGGLSRVCDVRDPSGVVEAFGAAAREHGPFHALAAIAGVGGPNEPGEVDRWDELVATNLTGTYNCVRAFEANLAESDEPRHVVVISSILARIGVPGYSGYSASKAGLLGLVRSFAAEWAQRNVLVNAICPGWVETDMAFLGLDATGLPREEAYAQAMTHVPLGRMAQPEEVAGTVAWLFSDDARSITGQAIDQNGGAFML